MPKQKYYYAVVHKETGEFLPWDCALPIFSKKIIAAYVGERIEDSYKVVPIPADSLHKLIKEHTKKVK